MSGDTGFTVTPADLAGTSGRYTDLAQGVKEVHEKLLQTLNEQGDCWGGDEAGAAFAKDYVPYAVQALRQMDEIDGGVQAMAAAVRTWAKNYQSVDKA